ncbi:hypothetical protein D3C86_2209160 [compost metagenome]
MALLGMNPSGSLDRLQSFGDGDQVSEWAKQAMVSAVGAGIFSGSTGNQLAPDASLTRAETATIIARLLYQSGLVQ